MTLTFSGCVFIPADPGTFAHLAWCIGWVALFFLGISLIASGRRDE